MPWKIGEVAEKKKERQKKRKKERRRERKRKAQEELTNLPDNSCLGLKNF
jgi:hypothetical protein